MTTEQVSIRVSAPGKVILHGEHSVVYGKLALAASLGLRTRVHFREVEVKTKEVISLEFLAIDLFHCYNLQDINELLNKPIALTKPQSNYNYTHPELIDHDAFIESIKVFISEKGGSRPLNTKQEQALTAFIYLLWAILGTIDVELKPFHVKLESELTIAAGIGSSASLSVAVAAFLFQFIKIKRCKSKSLYKSFKLSVEDLKEFDKDELDLISRWGFQVEKIIHGTPSGVDNTICTFGSMVEFYKGTSPRLFKVTAKFSVILIDTNIPRDTKIQVQKVAVLRDKHRAVVDAIFEVIDKTTVAAMGYIKKINNRMGDEFDVLECYEALGELTDINQNILRTLNVSHPKLEEICQILNSHGFHGKLTGAGGGGFAISLVPPYVQKAVVDKVVEELNSKGFKAVLTALGSKGVSID